MVNHRNLAQVVSLTDEAHSGGSNEYYICMSKSRYA